MLTAQPTLATIGAGAIGGVTAACIRQAGHAIEIVCKHEGLAEKIRQEGIHITGIKGSFRVKMDAVAKISALSEPKGLVFLATKASDCIAAARELLLLLQSDSLVDSLQNGISEYAPAEARERRRCRLRGRLGASSNGSGELEATSHGESVIGRIANRANERLQFVGGVLSGGRGGCHKTAKRLGRFAVVAQPVQSRVHIVVEDAGDQVLGADDLAV